MRQLAIACMALLLSFTATANAPAAPNRNHHIPYRLLTADVRQEVDCLADNIYFEAGNQSDVGKLAVAQVTMNRVKSEGFPSSICGVVKQKVSSTCQFSWWCDARVRAKATSKRFDSSEYKLYKEIRELASYVFLHHDKLDDVTKGATFYHATYVQPRWKGVQKTTRIGQHIFYRKVSRRSLPPSSPSDARGAEV